MLRKLTGTEYSVDVVVPSAMRVSVTLTCRAEVPVEARPSRKVSTLGISQLHGRVMLAAITMIATNRCTSRHVDIKWQDDGEPILRH